MDQERQKIDQILDVVFLHFKLCGDRLLKLTVRAKAAAAGKLNLTSEQLESQETAITYEKTVVETAIMRTVEQWLDETEASYLVSDKVSVADLAVYHALKQALVFGQMEIDAAVYPRLSEWYGWIEEMWQEGQLKGKQQFSELCDRISGDDAA